MASGLDRRTPWLIPRRGDRCRRDRGEFCPRAMPGVRRFMDPRQGDVGVAMPKMSWHAVVSVATPRGFGVVLTSYPLGPLPVRHLQPSILALHPARAPSPRAYGTGTPTVIPRGMP